MATAMETLNETLKGLGYTTRKAGDFGQKAIIKNGRVAFTGHAIDIWTWLCAHVPEPVFVTGKPVTFNYVRNTEVAPKWRVETREQQRIEQSIEPAGRYIIHTELSWPVPESPSQWEAGTITFMNPLVVPQNTGGEGEFYGFNSWKINLSARYGGKTGKALSRAVVKDGHDGIVTITEKENGEIETSEIVDLTSFTQGASL